MTKSTCCRQLAFALLVTLLAGPLWPEPVPVAGSQIALDPPTGFVPATTFPGFEQRDAAATIIVAELPVGFATIQAGFTEEALLTQGMVLEERQSQRFSDAPGELIRLQQNAPNGVKYRKWLALFGDSEKTILITAGVPLAKADELGPAMINSLLSAVWQRTAQVQEQGLLFRMQGPKGLEHRQRFMNLLSWSKADSDALAPTLIVGNSFLSPAKTPLEEFARLRLAQTQEVRELGRAKANRLQLDELPAVELIAAAEDAESGEALTVYQVMAYDGDIYYLIQGFASEAKDRRWLKRFRAATETFRRHREGE